MQIAKMANSNRTIVVALLLFACCFTATVGSKPRANSVEDAITRRAHQRSIRESALLDKLRSTPTSRLLQRSHHIKATDPKDKQALEDFYKSTNGNQWVNNSKWMKGDPCQDGWYGLYCSQDGHVLELGLVYNYVSGSIPSSISDLTSLQSLLLYSNEIQGTLPESLFTMSSLQTLDLDNNQISGTLPSTISMSNLTVLNLFSNKIKGEIPTEWNTPNLQTLSLSSNLLTGSLPSAIGKLSKLTSLVLSRNMLTGSLMSEYGDLNELQTLWLFNNIFEKPVLPDSWARMKNLVNVELDGLSGEVPSWINSWDKVENLVIVDGHLTGSFPASFCSFKKVQYLHIFNNSLSGTIPDCVCDLPQSLVSLEMSDNNFNGQIPECIGKLNLTELYLSRNNISGHLPRTLGDIAYLNILDVSSNSIAGLIPSSFRGLTNRTYGLFLCYNRLSSFEPGLDPLFDFIKGYTCALYENPWSCPLPSYVPDSCEAKCSSCNTGSKRISCDTCDGDPKCGWCEQGLNCLAGSSDGPTTDFWCDRSNWHFGPSANCPK